VLRWTAVERAVAGELRFKSWSGLLAREQMWKRAEEEE
jgi:hypothetical protein